MIAKKSEEGLPKWVKRAQHISHKPDWVDLPPRNLWTLGKVFFPIPRGRKGWNYLHHFERNRYEPDSETLNAYLEAGFGYGIACAGDLIVVDIDEPDYRDEIVSNLPETMYQWTGSGTGVHLFYICEGVTQRSTLFVLVCEECEQEFAEWEIIENEGSKKDEYYCPHCGEERNDTEGNYKKKHLGEIKADPNGYVVGPGSIHPSGSKYGPLKGDSIEEISEDELYDAIGHFIIELPGSYTPGEHKYSSVDYEEYENESSSEFYNLRADDVLPWLEPENRITHPIHGSDTGSNFMKNTDGDTFVCWRCNFGTGGGCVISAQHFLALEAIGETLGDYACENIRKRWHNESVLHYYAWRQAVDNGIVPLDDTPYTVLKGFMVDKGAIEEEDRLIKVYEAEQLMKYELVSEALSNDSD